MRFVTGIALLLTACAPPAPEFEVPAGTRGAVVSFEYGGPQRDLAGLRVRVPGSMNPEEPFVNLGQLADGGLAASFTLTRPFADVPTGTWSIDAPDAGGAFEVTVVTAAEAMERPPVNLRFLILNGCVDDEPELLVDLDDFATSLQIDLGLQVSRGRVSIERIDTPVGCTEEDSLLRFTAPLVRAEREFTFLITGQPLASGLGGQAPIGAVTGRSGALLSMGIVSLPLQRTDFGTRRIILHELGHLAGLRHTVEASGATDALEDTAPCADASDADGNGKADQAECGIEASANFMFWSTRGVGVSPSQLDVLLRSPSVGPP
jgi:hypothetical protein